MWIKGLELVHIRGFANESMQFSKNINVIVGANNAGKSTILQSIHLLQKGHKPFGPNDRRKGETEGKIAIKIERCRKYFYNYHPPLEKWPREFEQAYKWTICYLLMAPRGL
jgi:predicted ATP-dependent endonuclease of OLD family